MKFSILLVFLVIVTFAAGNAMSQCLVETDASPRLVNIKLGMTASEANTALGGAAKAKIKDDGKHSFFKNYLKIGKAKGRLAGARAFYMRFYERRVYQTEIFYHSGYRWNDLESFVRDYSNENGFAFENFVFKNGYAKAECVGFSIQADYILNPHIEITDETVVEKMETAGL